MGKVIAVTGGAGFIGTNICLEAKKRGHSVVAFDSLVRPKSEENIPVLRDAGVEICRGDVRLMHDFYRMPVPDAIIHLAANPGIPWSQRWPSYDFEVNAKGTINVLEYARSMGEQLNKKITVILASTNKVYTDLINEIPLDEEETRYKYRETNDLQSFYHSGFSVEGINELFPVDGFGRFHHSPYGASKLAADQYVQEYHHEFGLNTVVNRMSCIYGLYQKGVEDQGWIDHFIRSFIFKDAKLNFYGDGKQVRDMLWGGDVAKLYLDEVEQIEKVSGQVFNIGGGTKNTLSLLESVQIIEDEAEGLGLKNSKFNITHYDWRSADQKVYISDIAKVEKVLGWKPKVSPRSGIRKMIDAYCMEENNEQE